MQKPKPERLSPGLARAERAWRRAKATTMAIELETATAVAVRSRCLGQQRASILDVAAAVVAVLGRSCARNARRTADSRTVGSGVPAAGTNRGGQNVNTHIAI
jgi:hypothetical protein